MEYKGVKYSVVQLLEGGGWRYEIRFGDRNHKPYQRTWNTDGRRAAMAEYRAYTLGRDEHFIGFEQPLVCADDAEAIDQAKRLVNGSDIELWTGARLVARLEAKTKK
jgi:hypothetical protein